jgi:PHD/YefM family antitoxin component YafN of YafNO toxin-antitoxin module
MVLYLLEVAHQVVMVTEHLHQVAVVLEEQQQEQDFH